MSRHGLGLRTLWLRHLRRRGPGLLLALLTAVTTAFVLAAPRMQGTAYDDGVGDALAAQPAPMRELLLTYRNTAPPLFGGDLVKEPAARLDMPNPPTALQQTATRLLGPALDHLAYSSVSATTDRKVLTGPGRSPTGDNRQAIVRIQQDFDAHVRYDTGGPPPTASKEVVLESPTRFPGQEDDRWPTAVVPAAIRTETATSWGVKVGDRFTLGFIDIFGDPPRDVIVEIAGTYTPLDRADPFWQAEPQMINGAVYPSPEGGSIEQVTFVTGPGNYAALGAALYPTPDGGERVGVSTSAGGLLHEWRYAFDGAGLDRAGFAEILDGITTLQNDSTGWGLERPTVTTGLPSIAEKYNRSLAVTTALVLFPVLGLLALSAIVLGLATYVLISRRAEALRLLRTRGAGTRQIAGLAIGEAIWWPVLVLAPVAAAVLLSIQGVSPLWSFVLGATPPVVVALVAGVTGVLAARSSARGNSAEQSGGPGAAGAARRVVLELFLIAAAFFAVGTVRSRGQSVKAGGIDWYAAMAPVLLALAVAVVVLRLYPWPIKFAARLAERGRSLIGFVGLAGSARERGAALVPLAALVVACTIATFLTAVTGSIDSERAITGYRSVGADVRIDAERIDPEEFTALAARPGVSAVVPAYRESGTGVSGGPLGTRSVPVTVVATDLAALADSLDGTPAHFSVPAMPAAGNVLPALSSAAVAPVGTELTVDIAGAIRPIRIVGVDPGLNRASTRSTAPVIALDFDALKALQSGVQTNTAFIRAGKDAAAALAEGEPTKLTESVSDRYAFENQLSGEALPTLVRAISWVAMVLALGLAALSIFVLLTLTRARRELLTVRLRTMGLPGKGSWRLGAVEVLPLVLAGALPGVALGMYLPTVMASVIDLGPFTGGVANPPLRASLPGAGAVLGVTLILALLAIALDARRARRTRLAEHLRAGAS